MTDRSYISEKLKEIFEDTVESGLIYEGDLDQIDYYSLFCKTAANKKLYKLMGNNLCMLKCKYENQDSVLIVSFIPINVDETGAKSIAERVIEVVSNLESCFVTLDSLKSEEVKEDKFIYVTAVKTIKGD
jgi:hypothetical protein